MFRRHAISVLLYLKKAFDSVDSGLAPFWMVRQRNKFHLSCVRTAETEWLLTTVVYSSSPVEVVFCEGCSPGHFPLSFFTEIVSKLSYPHVTLLLAETGNCLT